METTISRFVTINDESATASAMHSGAYRDDTKGAGNFAVKSFGVVRSRHATMAEATKAARALDAKLKARR